MTALLATVIVGVGTYLSRASFILTLADRDLPLFLKRAMRNVGPAVLAALVASLLVGDEGLSGLAPSPETVSLVIAGGVAWKTRNVVATLVAGMISIWTLNAIW